MKLLISNFMIQLLILFVIIYFYDLYGIDSLNTEKVTKDCREQVDS